MLCWKPCARTDPGYTLPPLLSVQLVIVTHPLDRIAIRVIDRKVLGTDRVQADIEVKRHVPRSGTVVYRVKVRRRHLKPALPSRLLHVNITAKMQRSAIIAEHHIEVKHALYGLPGSALDDITTVRSHPVALGQAEDQERQKRPEREDRRGSN